MRAAWREGRWPKTSPPRGLNLPSWPDIGEEEFELVRRAIDDFFWT